MDLQQENEIGSIGWKNMKSYKAVGIKWFIGM